MIKSTKDEEDPIGIRSPVYYTRPHAKAMSKDVHVRTKGRPEFRKCQVSEGECSYSENGKSGNERGREGRSHWT